MLRRKKATRAVPAQPRPRPLSQAVVVELPAPTVPREVDTAGPVTQRLATEHSSVRPCGALRAEGSARSRGGVVRTGWLRKSPPEKKLRRCAWTKRWFILRHGQMSGDPDVLEYYKNDRSKKPLRVINLNLCEHVGDGLRFKKKKLQYDFVFSIRTSERVFYLVAKTEEDKNEWVQSIRQICDFIQAEKRTDFLRKISLAIHGPCSSPCELSRSSQHLPRERKSSAPLHSSEPTLFTFERAVSNHMKSTLSASAPQVYPYLHQCVSGKAENASYSFSSGSSQCCHPVKSFTSTDSGDEEDYVPKQSLMCASPIPSDMDSPAPKKSTGSDDYVSPDFQPSSPSPHHEVPGAEPSMSLLTRMWSAFKLKKVKTQALQHTMLELAEVEQSSDPCKSAKQ